MNFKPYEQLDDAEKRDLYLSAIKWFENGEGGDLSLLMKSLRNPQYIVEIRVPEVGETFWSFETRTWKERRERHWQFDAYVPVRMGK